MGRIFLLTIGLDQIMTSKLVHPILFNKITFESFGIFNLNLFLKKTCGLWIVHDTCQYILTFGINHFL